MQRLDAAGYLQEVIAYSGGRSLTLQDKVGSVGRPEPRQSTGRTMQSQNTLSLCTHYAYF